ncbi:PucR family transcriptional regulator [Nocardioides malaquae]|nr:helix-turn-helix domain-containing protein [Nocardioides malaquae]
MVQGVRMMGEWPVVDDRVKELFRLGAEFALAQPNELLASMTDATLSGIAASSVSLDRDLVAAASVANAANLRQWAAANVHRPAERVRAELSDDALLLTRDLVRRGLETFAVDAFRAAQSVAWRMWMFGCFQLTSDVRELHPLLDVSSVSISTFIGDLQKETLRAVEEERDALTRGSDAERLAAVVQLLEGVPGPRERAERRLGHSLLGPHTAVVLWTEQEHAGAGSATVLAAAADAVARAAGVTRRLVVRPSAATWWLWLPTAWSPHASALDLASADWPGVRIAVGRPGKGVDGFRRSHVDATATQRLAGRMVDCPVLTRHTDVHLLGLLAGDPDRAQEFVRATLGRFADASDEDHEMLRVWLRHQCNTSATAGALFAHRNSVLRRLARADAMMPRPVAEQVVEVGVALQLLRLRG